MRTLRIAPTPGRLAALALALCVSCGGADPVTEDETAPDGDAASTTDDGGSDVSDDAGAPESGDLETGDLEAGDLETGDLDAGSLDVGDDPESDDLSGRWRELPASRRPGGLTAQQQEEISALEGIGYAAGSVAATEAGGISLHDATRAYQGLNLVVSGHAPAASLVDMDGEVLHTWSHEFRAAFPDAKPLRKNLSERTRMFRRARVGEDGSLMAIYEGNGLIKVDRDSNLVWAYSALAHHDLDVDGEGNVYVLTRVAHLVPRINAEKPILEDFVAIVDETTGEEKKVVSIVECFENSEYADVFDQVQKRGGDIFHTNTLEFLDGRHADASPAFARGNVLVSLRRLHIVAILDLDAKSVVWCRTGRWKLQHQPVLLDSGNMLLFDNNTPRRRRTEVLEFDPLTGEDVWSYIQDEPDVFFSKSCGAAQRLPNGNTLITESDYGRAFEILPDGTIVWEFFNPHRAGEDDELVATLFEVVRIARDSTASWLK